MGNVQEPLVSVIMPAYNASQYIEESIRSVQAQTVTNWELIVVDDCSIDDTCFLVRMIAESDQRIRLIHNETNSGVAKTRNRAIDMARGLYVAFLDSDDIWHPEKLKKQLQYMAQTGADLVYASYAIVDAEGAKRRFTYRVPNSIDLKGMLKNNVVGCSTVLMSALVAKRYRFRLDYYHEDYVLWLEMLRDGYTFVGVEDILVDYRYHVDSKAGNKIVSAKHRWRIYRDYLRFSKWKSGWYLCFYALMGLKKYFRLN